MSDPQTDFFARHNWTYTARDLNVNVSVPMPVANLLGDCFRELEGCPGIFGVVPPAWMHITVLRLGRWTEFSPQERELLTEQLSAAVATVPAFTAHIDSWWLWDGSVVLHLSPDDSWQPLYGAVRAAASMVIGPARVPHSPHGMFLPHVTVAYSTGRDQPTTRERLSGISPPTMSLSVAAAVVVRQRRTATHFVWDTLRELPLRR